MKKLPGYIIEVLSVFLLPFMGTAQNPVIPSLPSARLTDFSPLFHAIQPSRLHLEVNSSQRYMALKGHPQSYRLSVDGSPGLYSRKHSFLTFHGDLYALRSGFQRHIHGSFGMAAAMQVHPDWQLYADLTYDFGYLYYHFHDVVTEHPEYQAVDNRYSHTPSASIGFVFSGEEFRVGFAATGAAILPGREFSVSGTAFLEQNLGAYTNNAYRHMTTLLPYLNYTYYSYDRTGHTVTVGLNARYSFFYASMLYRATREVQIAGLGVGFDFGKYCHLSYRFLLPFRFKGVMAGVAGHHLAFQVRVPTKKSHR